MGTLYKENILDHYKNPRNFGLLDDFDKKAVLSNGSCGDEVEIRLKLNGDVIASAGFIGSGCAISIAAMSMLTLYIQGKSVQECLGLKDEIVLDFLGMEKLSARSSCALLSLSALKRALE